MVSKYLRKAALGELDLPVICRTLAMGWMNIKEYRPTIMFTKSEKKFALKYFLPAWTTASLIGSMFSLEPQPASWPTFLPSVSRKSIQSSWFSTILLLLLLTRSLVTKVLGSFGIVLDQASCLALLKYIIFRPDYLD